MLPHYQPLKVAENFRMIAALHPGRVDLGLGNNPGIKGVQKAMDSTQITRFDYRGPVKKIMNYLLGNADENGIMANPQIEDLPSLWVLSSSVRSAKMAAELGIGYCFGLFPFASEDKLKVGREACRVYRENFKPSPFLAEPYITVAPFLTVSDDPHEAEAYAKALDLWLLGKDHFEEFDRFPSIETSMNYKVSIEDQEQIDYNRNRMVVGDTQAVAEQLQMLVDDMRADELLLIPLMPTFEARKHAIEILARALNKNSIDIY